MTPGKSDERTTVHRLPIILVLGGLTAQAADTTTYRATNGAVVAAPEIAALDCPQMAQVLRNLDNAQYRNSAPLRPGDADWPIFDYEDHLASAYYTRCTVGLNRKTDPLDAFSRGFDGQ